MRKLLFGFIIWSSLFVTGLQAQEYPTVITDDTNFIIEIPYLEFENEDGDTKALSAELTAPLNTTDFKFDLNTSSIMDVEVDTPAMISGDGSCSRTSNAQFLSCRADVQTSFFVLQANCFNITDEDDQQDCFEESQEDRGDDLEECDDIEEAHLNLCVVLGEDAYDPDLDDFTFLSVADTAANPNPYFPLIVGNTWVYDVDEGAETVTVQVLDETREIEGIDAIVVQELVEEDGELVEISMAWYAQDEEGDVWYLGELAQELEDGGVTVIDGSWEAGEDGAKAGIVFRGIPIEGEVQRQGYFIGEAEDIVETIGESGDESTSSGFDCLGACLQNLEYTPLEPGVEESKFYKPNVGLIVEIDLEDDERVELVDFTAGN